MQTMLRLVGFGDDTGSGFPAILDTWAKEGWLNLIMKHQIQTQNQQKK